MTTRIKLTADNLAGVARAIELLRQAEPIIGEALMAAGGALMAYDEAPLPMFDSDEDFERWGESTGFKTMIDTAFELCETVAKMAHAELR